VTYRAPLAVVALALVALAACGTGTASPSPGGFQEVFEALARRGATVTRIVSGDPGCSDPTLVANAVRFHVQLDDGVDREVHLFGFRDATALARAQASLDECMRSFVDGHPGESIGSVQVGPFHALGAPWSERLSVLLTDALREAIGGS
jgi:hypothetical protein